MQQYSQQSKAFASEIWGHLKIEQLKENLHQLWLIFITLKNEIRENAVQFPKTVYHSFIKALGKQCKQNLLLKNIIRRSLTGNYVLQGPNKICVLLVSDL